MPINTPAPDFVPEPSDGAFVHAIVSVLDLAVNMMPFALFLLIDLAFNGRVYVFERVSSRSIQSTLSPPLSCQTCAIKHTWLLNKIPSVEAAQIKCS